MALLCVARRGFFFGGGGGVKDMRMVWVWVWVWVWVGPGSGIGGWGDLTRGLGGVGVLEAGLEPARPLWPKDFKSFVSTIPPFERGWGEEVCAGCARG